MKGMAMAYTTEKKDTGFLSESEINDFDSRTIVKLFKESATDEDIRSEFAWPDGTPPCECSICMADGDCCGHWGACGIHIHRAELFPTMVVQNWYCNV